MDEPTYTFKQSSELPITLFEIKPNYNITYYRDGKQIGVLDFNGPEITFVGDADESAKLFFDYVARAFKGRLEQERADEREACAYRAGIAMLGADRGLTNRVDQAIRARSNT